MTAKIAFQGEPGAYSHEACRQARPGLVALPCATFEDAIDAVRRGEAELAALPVENSTYGRVADMHALLPGSGLHIIDEAFVRIHICLLGTPGARLEDVHTAMSHPVLLGQCREFLRAHGIRSTVGTDTAGSAKIIADRGDKTIGALASEISAEIYGLDVLARQIEDQSTNTTRFIIMAREPDLARRGSGPMMTSFLFSVRNIPAALYKALGGFATNGVNMTKLESYMVGGSFTATAFLADIEGHPEDANVARALEELRYFSAAFTLLGVYPADRRRG
jgi:prephenate dehydratase